MTHFTSIVALSGGLPIDLATAGTGYPAAMSAGIPRWILGSGGMLAAIGSRFAAVARAATAFADWDVFPSACDTLWDGPRGADTRPAMTRVRAHRSRTASLVRDRFKRRVVGVTFSTTAVEVVGIKGVQRRIDA